MGSCVSFRMSRDVYDPFTAARQQLEMIEIEIEVTLACVGNSGSCSQLYEVHALSGLGNNVTGVKS
jgi:hypothetical protein